MSGVSNNEIDQMEKTVALLSEANAEVDRLREELSPKVKKMNDLIMTSAINVSTSGMLIMASAVPMTVRTGVVATLAAFMPVGLPATGMAAA